MSQLPPPLLLPSKRSNFLATPGNPEGSETPQLWPNWSNALKLSSYRRGEPAWIRRSSPAALGCWPCRAVPSSSPASAQGGSRWPLSHVTVLGQGASPQRSVCSRSRAGHDGWLLWLQLSPGQEGPALSVPACPTVPLGRPRVLAQALGR